MAPPRHRVDPVQARRRLAAGRNRGSPGQADRREPARRPVARRGAAAGAAEVRQRRGDEGELSRAARPSDRGDPDARYAPGAASSAESAGLHPRHGADPWPWHRRNHVDVHARACGRAGIAARREPRRALSPRPRIALLLLHGIPPAGRLAHRLVRSLHIFARQHERLRGPGGVPGPDAASWRTARWRPRRRRERARRIRVRQLLQNVRRRRLRGPRDRARRRPAERAACGGDELPVVA